MEEKRYSNPYRYIEGNAVRQLEPAPSRGRERDRNREREDKRRQEIQRRNKKNARRNQEKALRMDFGYVAFLTIAACVTAFVSATYIQMQSSVTSRMENIGTLQTQVSDLKADNDSMEKRISTAVDLETVKDMATNQLGMVYASAEQIIYYTVDDDDYMNQYGEIPEK